jgi:murein DD-endopeptidase MepM/ murein hydrolase activator NlpD
VGIYNSQYESYYSKFSGNRKNYNPYASNFQGKNRSEVGKINLDYFMKRLLRELIGVFIMLLIVFICKSVVTPQTTTVYGYCKVMVNKNYDYTYLLSNIKYLKFSNIKDYEERIENYIDELKAKVNGGDTVKEKVKKNFISPIKGEVVLNESKDGIDIEAKAGTEVVAASDGIIKEVNESQQLGKYILIDHGSGIESRYSYLNSTEVKSGSEIKKGELIGKSGTSFKTADSALHFELIYMGESINPKEYMNFN